MAGCAIRQTLACQLKVYLLGDAGMSSLMALFALVASMVVYRRFQALGGAKGYVAPE